MPIGAPMHVTAMLEHENGATASLLAAKESFGYSPRMEIYGTEGILYAPRPNMFHGEIRIQQRNGETHSFPYSHGFAEDSRGIGVADMAYAIRSGRKHRASGELASHVLDIQLGIMASSKEGRHIAIPSRCEQPAPSPLGLEYNQLD